MNLVVLPFTLVFDKMIKPEVEVLDKSVHYLLLPVALLHYGLERIIMSFDGQFWHEVNNASEEYARSVAEARRQHDDAVKKAFDALFMRVPDTFLSFTEVAILQFAKENRHQED